MARASLKEQSRSLRARTRRRLFGIDRSGPPPAPTRSGQPLNPWTLPNAIGFIRLGLIPVFLLIALSTGNGRSGLAAAIFGVVAWADYLDGFAARLTGQFSRLGALLDPIVDRLLVISGMVVAWDFTLLPRWAIGIAIGRELFMVGLTRYGFIKGVDLKINWAGRIGVAPTMGATFFAMVGVHWLGVVLLYIGLVFSLTASFLYMRHGIEQSRKLSSSA